MSVRNRLFSILVAGIVCSLAAAPAVAQERQVDVVVLVGSEDLAGYGPLTFRLFNGFRADMTDKDGITIGSWSRQGGDIYLPSATSCIAAACRGSGFRARPRTARVRGTGVLNSSASLQSYTP